MLETARTPAVTANLAAPHALFEIRSWAPEHKSGATAVTFDGRELPREVGTILVGPVRALCLAPGHWLLVCEDESAAQLAQQAGASLSPQGAVLVEATDGLAVLTVRGPAARDVLAKGSGLDFYAAAFPVGRCARTRLAQMAVVIEHVDDAPTFHCYVARSYLQYLADWIEDAAVEFSQSS